MSIFYEGPNFILRRQNFWVEFCQELATLRTVSSVYMRLTEPIEFTQKIT
jgi:hypothetical protein